MVPLAEEHAVRPETGLRKSRILDQNALEANDLIQREAVFGGLQDGASPSFQAVPRGTLAFDFEAGATVREEHETGRARDQMGARAADGFPRLGSQLSREEIRQGFSATNDRTEAAVAEQIIAD